MGLYITSVIIEKTLKTISYFIGTYYHPFGLTMAGISHKALSFGNPQNKKKFNDGTELSNKEFSDGSGLELYETMFRGYDPQIGRFYQIDPLAFLTSERAPYSFALNNPMLRNDPTGLKDSIRTLPEVVVVSKIPKLKGGIYNGQTFSRIKTWDNFSLGSWSSRTKTAFTNEEILARLNASQKSLEELSKKLQIIGALGGGSNIVTGVQSIMNYKEFGELVKDINSGKVKPGVMALLVIGATGLYLEGLDMEENAKQLAKIVDKYEDMRSTVYTPNPADAKGMYVITTMNVSGGTGGAAFNSTTSYYDISTKQLIGEITSRD